MRIGYEAKRAFLNNPGLGNYSRGVIKMLALNYPGNDYLLYTPKIGAGKNAGFMRGYPQVKIVKPKNKLFSSLWRSKTVIKDLKRDGIELYHGLSHELPFTIHKSGIKTIVTIHDLIFKRFPTNFGWVSRHIYDAKVTYACKHADGIIAISQKTKADLIELYHIHPEKIEIIYQGCDEVFKQKQTDQTKATVKKRYKLPDNFILSVGTIEKRKNLLLLVMAFRMLPKEAYLVLVGKQTEYVTGIKQYIAQHHLESRVLFVENAEFADLPAIYQQAQVFVYPSRYEGFGIPVLEAIFSGVPVIAATGSCLEEAGGPDSLYIDPDDEINLAEKLRYLLLDKNKRQKMIDNGLKYARRFEADKLAAQMMQLYTKTLNHA
jgi:glycosyltransferase involved in cell wall biosynthesis